MSLRLGSLCSGAGLLDLAIAQVLDTETVWHAENDPHASRVLAHHWPDVPNRGDITAMDWTTVEPVDVLAAGYPCTPFSQAGLRQGVDDARHLWPYVAEAIRHLRPGLVCLENVAGHLSLGFGTVLGDLAALGYVGSWRCIRAADIGAPHLRDRVFIAAVPNTDRQGLQGRPTLRQRRTERSIGTGRVAVEWGPYQPGVHHWERLVGRPAPSPVDDAGRLAPRFSEWLMGLPDGWVTGVPGLSREAQLRALGNGVVPAQGAAAYADLLGVQEAAA